MRFVGGGALPIGALVGSALGGVLGLPLTLVVAEFGMLLAFLWLLLSPVRTLQSLPALDHGAAPGGDERDPMTPGRRLSTLWPARDSATLR